MRDRTHELRQGDDSSDDEDKERVALVVQPGTARLGSPDDEFFQKVRTIRQAIVKLENKVRELEKQQVTILATPLPEESMKQDLQNLRDEIKQLGREIRAELKAIEPQKEEADENYNSVNMRMRKTQHGVLSQQFVELINKCNSMQSEYREKNVERIRRQLKITNAGMVSDEELEQMLDSGQSEVFVSNILKDTQVTRQALNEISARHSEIQQLERSIRELHEIFTFLATEVEMQGEMINRIEKNILSSADYVERGQEHVKMTLESQKKARKHGFCQVVPCTHLANPGPPRSRMCELNCCATGLAPLCLVSGAGCGTCPQTPGFRDEALNAYRKELLILSSVQTQSGCPLDGKTAGLDRSCPSIRLIWMQGPLGFSDSPPLPRWPASSEESCPVGRLCPLSHLSAFRVNNCMTCGTYWDLIETTSMQLGVHVLCVTSAWPYWTVPLLNGCLPVSLRKLSITSWKRWLDGQVRP
uniref:Syntaxin 4 n=1 Tax=Equus caballus TaxID=9796 RepID=A0A9L0RQQ1_HORSE